MNLSYKIHDNFKKNHNAGELTSKRQISSHSNFVPKKMISLEFPANITLSLPKLTHNNLFYSRNEASNKPTAHLKTMTETNNSTFFKSPKKKNRVINFIQSKINVNPMTINLKRQTSPLICRKEQSAENLLCNVYTDEPMQKSKEEVLKKINEENNLTEPILTEYSDIMVQELPNTKMFNNPKISKKISIESYENSTRTSSAFFGGKITQNNDFQYEKSVVKNSNMVFVINIDTGFGYN